MCIVIISHIIWYAGGLVILPEISSSRRPSVAVYVSEALSVCRKSVSAADCL